MIQHFPLTLILFLTFHEESVKKSGQNLRKEWKKRIGRPSTLYVKSLYRKWTLVWTNGITIGKVESIGNPAGIGQGTGFGLRERDRDGIGLGHYRLRAN